ncbi:MAG: DNA-3-methyladenine glycosylase family protein [Verrucomicrobiales bacterium]
MTPEAIAYLCQVDEKLATIIQAVGPCELVPEKKRSPFEGLVRAVANQQLSGKAAATILGRFTDLFPRKKFPAPSDVMELKDEQLTGVGFSRAKAKYIKAIAQGTLNGLVPSLQEAEQLTDDAIVERLTQLPGIGRWSVQMFLMFGLGRPDVLPIHDLGIQSGFRYTYNLRQLPKPERIHKHGERWRPYRTTASWYLWRAVDLAREKKK